MAAKCTQRCHNGEFRHVSISVRQRSLWCGQNLRGPFLRATLPMTVGSCARAMVDNGKTKGLITPPPKWVSAQLLYVCVTAWQRSRLLSQNLSSLFLRAVRLFIYITLITLHYAAQFSPYQECNYAEQFFPTRSVICFWLCLLFVVAVVCCSCWCVAAAVSTPILWGKQCYCHS